MFFFIISRSVLLRIRNVSETICTEDQNTRFVFDNSFPEIAPFMRKGRKNMVEPDRPQMAI